MMKSIRVIVLGKLIANQDNPNKMSISGFTRLVRNMRRTDNYEPILIRRCKLNTKYYQIINGYHRCRALLQLGYKNVDCIVWDVSDQQTNILIATLNRLNGRDDIDGKINLLRLLTKDTTAKELSKLLPYTTKQIEQLVDLRKIVSTGELKKNAKGFLNTLVFFVTDKQNKVIEKAISKLGEQVKDIKTKAAKRAAALTVLAEYFIDHINK